MSVACDINHLWFMLLGLLLTGYVLLDGFDLGVGILHIFVKKDEHRRILLNAIGPVWDGNEVWLITGGGALFAAFPLVYATVFSGFYFAFILLLMTLILRAVAIEFRSRHQALWWRRLWDLSFFIGSAGASVLFGVAIGNIAQGIPLTTDHQYWGGFFALLRPYPLLIGVLSVVLFLTHGCLYLLLKTEGELNEKIQRWAKRTALILLGCYIAAALATFIFIPSMTDILFRYPLLFGIPFLSLLALANIFRELHRARPLSAFLSSGVLIVTLMVLFGLGMYPNLVLSHPVPEHSLTLYNAASSPKTLNIMLVIAAMGMPFVLCYTAAIYWIFRGKVKLDPNSY